MEKDDQFLLYVTGKGGTGKSWIIDSVKLGMKLLERDREVLVLGILPTMSKVARSTRCCRVST